MTVSSIEIWRRIAAEGIANPSVCRLWAAETAKSMPASESADGEKVLRQLLQNGHLSEYQVNVLSGKQSGILRQGNWLVHGPVPDPTWQGWLQVAAAEPSGPAQTEWYARILREEELDTLAEQGPSMTRVKALARMEHESLQRVAALETVRHNGDPQADATPGLLVRVAPPPGKSMAMLFHSKQLKESSADAAMQQVKQIATALSELHKAGLSHGRVMLDRVYQAGSKVTLAIDPLCAALTPFTSDHGLLHSSLEPLSASQFTAPEFLVPGHVPTPQTDIFALGCLWRFLLAGERGLHSGDGQQVLALHTKPFPNLPESVDVPATHIQVLMHCTAPNPGARFANASALCDALAALGTFSTEQQSASQQARTPEPRPTPARPSKQTRSSPADAPAASKASDSVSDREPEVRATAVRPQPAKTSKPHAKKPESRVAGETKTAPSRKPIKPAAAQPQAKVSEQQEPQSPASKKKDAPSHTTARAKPSAPNSVLQPTGTAESSSEGPQTRANRASTSRPNSSGTTPRKRRKKKSAKWMIPVVGSFGFLVVLLLLLQFSGVLRSPPEEVAKPRPPYVPSPADPRPSPPPDPVSESFRIVSDDTRQLWAPPFVSEPVDLTLLPPGAGCFLALTPERLLSSEGALGTAFPEVESWLRDYLRSNMGTPLSSVQVVTLAFYDPVIDGEQPQIVCRVTLREPTALSALAFPGRPEPLPDGEPDFFWAEDRSQGGLLIAESSSIAENGNAPSQDLSVSAFSVGPLALMKEAQDFQGQMAPLPPAVEKIWSASYRASDLVLLASSAFLKGPGRGLLTPLPDRLQAQVAQLLDRDTRAVAIQSAFSPDWYCEVKLVGQSDQGAGRLMQELRSGVSESANRVETWFVSETPHPAWRSIAIRYPLMLRTVARYARYGIEDGVAIANLYLPRSATESLLLATWLALQEGATLSGSGELANSTIDAPSPLSMEQYLARPVTLLFDQEPIEEAFRLLSEEGNDRLPAGTPTVTFRLDGDAFELAGITRNMQMQDFRHSDRPLREALTELARRGNPDPSVKDTHDAAQSLIWVTLTGPDGQSEIILTTRAAASKLNAELPSEFTLN